MTMSTALEITTQAYEAFDRPDIPALLKLVADEVHWKSSAPASWPHAGLRRNPAEMADFFFAALDRFPGTFNWRHRGVMFVSANKRRFLPLTC
jgi:hypothetical protein